MVNLPEAIISLEAYDESINMLLIAESGWGKTVLAGTADRRNTDGTKALFIATENGTISAARQHSTADLWPVRRWPDLVEAYAFMAQGGGCGIYQWLLIDSITELQKLSMDNALRTAVAANKGRDPDVPAIQDHLKVQQQTLNMLRRFNELPVNCLYTALPLRLEDEDGNPYFLPALDGKQGGIAQQAMGYMHVVGHGVKRNVKVEGTEQTRTVRRVYFQSNGPYKAKDRYGVLGRFQDNTTVPILEDLINKDKPKDAMRVTVEADSRIVGGTPPAITSTSTETVDAEIVDAGDEF